MPNDQSDLLDKAEIQKGSLSPFQLQKTAAVCERPLRARWPTTAAPTSPAAAFHESTLLFVTERELRRKVLLYSTGPQI